MIQKTKSGIIRSLKAIHGAAVSIFTFAPISITTATGASILHPKVQEAFFFTMIETVVYRNPIFCFVDQGCGCILTVHCLWSAHIFVIFVDETTHILIVNLKLKVRGKKSKVTWKL